MNPSPKPVCAVFGPRSLKGKAILEKRAEYIGCEKVKTGGIPLPGYEVDRRTFGTRT